MKEKNTKVLSKEATKEMLFHKGRLLIVPSANHDFFVGLIFRIGYFQFVRGAEYKEITARQSTSS